MCRASRALLDMSQTRLAEAADVGLSTVAGFEKGRTMPMANNLAAIEAALKAAGVVFIMAGDDASCDAVGIAPTE
jgi:transcriptional regulator with XRE-family HTH domain